MRGSVEATAVVLGGILLACVFTLPYIFNFTNAGRLDTNDGRWSIWVVAWVAHALTTEPSQLFRANIFYPHPNALAFSEGNIVAGIIGAPVWVLTKNPYATHNFVFLFAFAQSFVATYYLIRRLTGDRRAAVIAGIMFAYCPFAFVRQAHIQLLLIGFLPWCMLAWHRFLDRINLLRALELGIVLAVTGLACAYYGIFAGGMVSFAAIWFGITRRRWQDLRYWGHVGAAAATCIAIITPFFLPYLQMQESTGFQRELTGQYSANLGAWLASSAWAHRWWFPYLTKPSESIFPGILAIVLGVAGARIALRDERRDVAWFYIGLAIFTFWLTLGPAAGLYTVLYHTVPVFSFLRAPSRAGIVVTLCLVVLAAPAMIAMMKSVRLAHGGRRANRLFVVLLLLVTADLYRAPLRMRTAPPLPEAYRALRDLPKSPTLVLPYWATSPEYHRHAEYMLLAAANWQPLINGYSDHIPQDFRNNAPVLATFPSPGAFAVLQPMQARYAVVHLELMNRENRERMIRRLDEEFAGYLRPITKEG
ncbi:MAG TPA: hypothetical protein VEA16_20945, partial [Vicinamibacterales bacterium]|nr:hypothetical protein [Vicinamibacterales bacterium]